MRRIIIAQTARAGRVLRLRRRRANGERPRVMILVNTLAPYGAETFVANHACHADRSRFDVTVCHMGGPDALAPRIRDAGVEVINLGDRRRPLAAMARLGALLRSRRVDIVQTHIIFANVVGRLAGTAAQVPLIVSTEQGMHGVGPAWLRSAADLTFKLADANVFISRAVAQSFGAAFPEVERAEPRVISNGIDTRRIAQIAAASRAEVRRELGIAEGELAFANVGRLVPLKGQRFAIQALARAGLPHASLWIVGGGELEAQLRELAAAEGVADRVHLLGERLDVHRLLGAFDVYVHPSTREGLGIAPLEAMSAGLPTIGAAVGGIPEFVRDGDTGWLIPSGDVDALADRMRRVALSTEESRRLAERGRALVFAEHDIRGSVAAYERIYLDLLS